MVIACCLLQYHFIGSSPDLHALIASGAQLSFLPDSLRYHSHFLLFCSHYPRTQFSVALILRG